MSRRTKFILLCSAALFSFGLFAQLIPVWDGQRILPVKIGSTLQIQNGTLDTNPGRTTLHNDIPLAYDGGIKGWKLPAASSGTTIKAVMIYVNGLRYRPNVDYTIVNGVVQAAANNMDPSFSVTCDYWEQP